VYWRVSVAGSFDSPTGSERNADRRRYVSRRSVVLRCTGAPVGQFDGDGRSDCVLPTPPFPRSSRRRAPSFELVDQGRKGNAGMDHAGLVLMRTLRFGDMPPNTLRRFSTPLERREQRDLGSRSFARSAGMPAEASWPRVRVRTRRHAAIMGDKDAVEKQPLIGDTHMRSSALDRFASASEERSGRLTKTRVVVDASVRACRLES